MTIDLVNLGKRFKSQWVFKDLNAQINDGETIAIIGPNGSGKSTLIKIISAALSPSRGEVKYLLGGEPKESEQVFNYISYAAPYLELLEEYSLSEMIDFQLNFKALRADLTKEEVQSWLNFDPNKPIKDYSSGMKQRLKLALAVSADSDLLLLDEPTSNLDSQGMAWYKELIEKYTSDRTVLIGSNQPEEFRDFAGREIALSDFKS